MKKFKNKFPKLRRFFDLMERYKGYKDLSNIPEVYAEELSSLYKELFGDNK